jgi:hypothetical protein
MISSANGYLTLDDIKRIEALGMIVGGNARIWSRLMPAAQHCPFSLPPMNPTTHNSSLMAHTGHA